MFGLDDIAGALVGGAFGLLGSGFNMWSANHSAHQNQRYATNQQLYQTSMSNTAHQREMADLKAAGVNPLFSVTGGSGAVVPAGQSGSIAQASGVDSSGLANTAKEIYKYFDSQRANINADTDTKDEVANTEKKKQELLQKQIDVIKAQLPAVSSSSELEALQNDYEIIARRYLYNDKDYVGRDLGMRKLNLILPSALQTVNTAHGVVNAAALASHAHSYSRIAHRPYLGRVREFSNGMSFTDNYF